MTSWIIPVSSKLFKTRSTIPVSNKYVLVFPFDIQSSSFATDFYTPEMTNNRIQTSQLEAFFEEISETCNDFSLFKNWVDAFYVSIYIPLVLSIIFTHILEKYSMSLATAFFFAGLLLTLSILMWNIIRTKKGIQRYRNKIIGILNYSNQNLYEIMGLKWQISPNNFEWLELKLEYRIEKEPNQALFMDNNEEKRQYLGGKNQATYPVLINSEFDCIRQEVPPSTCNYLIFPFDYGKFCYQTYFYREELTGGRLKFQGLTDFEKSLSSVINNKYKSSKWAQVASIMQVLCIVGGIISCTVYTEANLYNTRRALALILSIMIVHVIQILKEFKRKKLFTEQRVQIIEFLDKYNKEIKSSGLRWVLSPNDIDWLELWFDYKFIDEDKLSLRIKDNFPTIPEEGTQVESAVADSSNLLSAEK